MRSNLLDAVLVSRTDIAGQAPRRRSLDLVWARLSAFERAQLEREVAGLAARGVQAAWRGEAPLFHTGVLESLRRRVIAVVGGREARADLVALAERAAVVATSAGATVLAGDTEGPEAAALAAAARRGGSTVAVLSEGFRRTGAPSPTGVTATTVVTTSAPGREWSIDTAMARNDTIAGLATALVAVGAASTGATIDAGMRALAARRPVLAVGATPGSRLLVDYGATAAIDDIEVSWWLENRLADPRVTGPLTVAAAAPFVPASARSASAPAVGDAAASGRGASGGRGSVGGRAAAAGRAPVVACGPGSGVGSGRLRRWSTA